MYRHIAITGPSGSGKSSLIWKHENSIMRVTKEVFDFSVSGTNRLPRKNEIHGKDYFFFPSEESFLSERFIEDNHYEGNKRLYGTLVSEVERIAVHQGRRICFDVDINGGFSLKRIFKRDLIFVFLDVPIPTLRLRLTKRREETGETDEQIEKRIIAAEAEKLRVARGEISPDLILPYDNDVTPGEAVNQILFCAGFGLGPPIK